MKTARVVAAKRISELQKTLAGKSNRTYLEKYKILKLKELYDTIHVEIHGRTAQEVKEAYPDSPRSWSAIEILRKHEPEIAKAVESKLDEYIHSAFYDIQQEMENEENQDTVG